MIWELLPGYEFVTLAQIGYYILAGFFGALVRISWLNKPLRGFYKDEEGWKMGFFAEIIVGIAVAIIVGGSPVRAGIAAIFGPSILNVLQTMITQTLPEFIRYAMTKGKGGTDGRN